jgi:secretin/TonB-like protein
LVQTFRISAERQSQYRWMKRSRRLQDLRKKCRMFVSRRGIGSHAPPIRPIIHGTNVKRLIVILAALAVAFICIARAAEPQAPSDPQQIDFEIPSQPLANALHAYGRRMGVQVLYESRSAIGRQSEAVHGRFTPGEALKRLLAATDLEVRHARSDAIILVAPSLAGQDLPPANPLASADMSIGELRVRGPEKINDLARFQDYSESVRAEIQRALLKNSKTGTGNYRAVLDLWIDPARTIQKTALLQSTGESSRDVAITSTLQGLMIKRPTPADAPQPIRAVVVVRTSQ